MARYRRFLKSLQRSFIALFRALLGIFVKAARKVVASKRHRSWKRSRLSRLQQAGFVLPTVTLILVVMGLVVGALLIRTSTRMEEVIVARKTQEIENAASPALDRARSKLEFMFAKDNQLPAGLPAEGELKDIMNNSNYNLDDEDRIDLDGDGNDDNAWVYDDGDTRVAYSIIFDTPNAGLKDFERGDGNAVEQRADALQVRNGPILAETSQIDSSCQIQGGGDRVEEGWFRDPVSAATFRKNFQVNAIALVPEGEELSSVGTIATMEMQQDRSANRGNKWGAWFLSDLEIYPGSVMDWNGAMHTEGNLLIGAPPDGGDFRSFLISSPNSCLFSEEFSELTTASIETENDQNGNLIAPGFQGQFGVGTILEDIYQDENFQIDWHDGGTNNSSDINSGNDSIDQSQNNSNPSDIFLDPVRLVTDGTSIARHRQEQDKPDSVARDWMRSDNWETEQEDTFNGRFFHSGGERRPRIDDIYRADDRAGPRATYGGGEFAVGDNLPLNGGTLTNDDLTSENPITTGEPDSVGLDGYWERRARNEGLRVIVGERLQLEDPGLIQGGGGVVNPANVGSDHINRQRMTLQDKLGAAQATLFYHHTANNPDFPVAVMASTVHPGTADTLKRSATFEQRQPAFNVATPAGNNTLYTNLFGQQFGDNNNEILVDFFTGRGTNGWEFQTTFNGTNNNFLPSSTGTASQQDLLDALNNLANFAGDPNGAFPPVQEGTNNVNVGPPGQNDIHPYPLMTKWGNFSDLRRALNNMTTGNNGNNNGYSGLSKIADKSTIQSASFMLGMLAYNISYLESFDLTNAANFNFINNSDIAPNNDLNGDGTNNNDNEVAEAINQSTASNTDSPEEVLAKLKTYLDGEVNNNNITAAVRDQIYKTARIVYLKKQVQNDRQNGGAACNLNPTPLNFLCQNLNIKYPALYYIFPLNNHGENGGGGLNNRFNDNYITNAGINGNINYLAMSNQDVANIALMPKAINNWTLPNNTNINNCPANARPNCSQEELIKHNGTDRRVAFKDSALFNGREQMNVRVLNMDLDMLANNSINNDTWLAGGDNRPSNFQEGGIVYAFREDAVREEEIARPDGGNDWDDCASANAITGCANDATNQTDPPLNSNTQISAKSVDFFPDPDRRPYGFRIKNGADLRRNGNTDGNTGTNEIESYGLSLISDQPVYIQGDFNLHSNEEFTDTLKDKDDWGNFYDRENLNSNFATAGGDDWRYSEIISDAVTIISDNFCDGSIEDGIIATGFGRNNATNNSGDDLEALLTGNGTNDGNDGNTLNRGPDLENDIYGCVDQSGSNGASSNSFPVTSYLNQNIGNANGFEDPTAWTRENPDLGSPIQIFADGNNNNNPRPEYNATLYNQGYYSFTDTWGDFMLPVAVDGQQVNTVMISGIVPSRAQQSFGGLHNFPRLLEDWNGSTNKDLFISGSLLQLDFSHYATAPYDAEPWDPNPNTSASNNTTSDDEFIRHYAPPNRRWGYDVGLQFVQPGPISKRLLQPAVARNEYYSEPELDDPYIENLRCATFTDSEESSTQVDPNANCF